MKKKILKWIIDLLEFAALYGLLYSVYKVYDFGPKMWHVMGCLFIIYSIHGYMMYRERNKEYFKKKEAKKYGE